MQWIKANWPAPTWVNAYTSTRAAGLRLNENSNTDGHTLMLHRQRVVQQFNLKKNPHWLKQIHSAKVVDLAQSQERVADGALTTARHQACVVLTADCVPILLCDAQGTVVAAVHAGWQGMIKGIIGEALSQLRQYTTQPIYAWLGPAISQAHYEVGDDFRDAFLRLNPIMRNAFIPQGVKWRADLYALARILLQESGVRDIYGAAYCTYGQEADFYSYRRCQEPDRMASLIWLGA